MIKDNQLKKEILKENKKNIGNFSPIILLILYLFLPALYLISLFLNTRLIIFNKYIFSIIFVLITILLTYLSCSKVNKYNEVSKAIIFILPFMSVINIIFCSFVISNFYCTLLMFVTLICSVILVMIFIDYKLKIISIAITGILLFLTWFIILVASFFGDFGSEIIIYEVKSPNNKLIAKIIDDDQGALGGNTYVGIYKNKKDINLGIVRFEQIPDIIYEGKWGEFETMTIKWSGNYKIVINGKTQSIKKKTINR